MSTPPLYTHPGNDEAIVEVGDGLVVGMNLDNLDYGHVIGIEYDEGTPREVRVRWFLGGDGVEAVTDGRVREDLLPFTDLWNAQGHYNKRGDALNAVERAEQTASLAQDAARFAARAADPGTWAQVNVRTGRDNGGEVVIRVTFEGHARPVVRDAVEAAVELALGPLWTPRPRGAGLDGSGAGVYRLAPVE